MGVKSETKSVAYADVAVSDMISPLWQNETLLGSLTAALVEMLLETNAAWAAVEETAVAKVNGAWT